MAAIRIRVGVAIDTPLQNVFKPLIVAAQQANKAVTAEMKSLAKNTGSVYRDIARDVGNANRDAERSGADAAKNIANEHERAARRAKSAWAQFASGFAGQAGFRAVGGYGRGNIARFAHAALGAAGSIARGAGVDFSLSSLVGSAVQNQRLARNIVGYGYIEGEPGAAGIRQNPGNVTAEARAAANASGLSTQSVLEGLATFTKKSSDLATGRAMLMDMAKFAAATGSSLEDVSAASGDIAKKLEGTPDKANAVKSAMMILARQGKLGAEDMSDMAKTISTMVAPSKQFAEGTAKAIGELGVLTQITKGYSKGPAQTATSVSSFAADLTSAAGLKGLRRLGINPFADKGKTKLRSLEDIVTESLVKSGGNLEKLSAAFRNKRSGSVVKAFGDIYAEGEKAKKGGGAEAVHATFAKYGGAASEADLNQQLKGVLEDPAAKAQIFQNNLERAAESMADRVLPALEKLAPIALDLAGALGRMLGVAIEHPIEAALAGLGVALAKSVAEAGLQQAIKSGLESGLGGIGGLTIGAATMAIAVADMVIQERKQKGVEEGAKDFEQLENKVRSIEKRFGEKGAISPEDKQELENAQKQLTEYLGLAKTNRPGQTLGGGILESIGSLFGHGRTAEQRGRASEAAAHESSAQVLARDLGRLVHATEQQNSTLRSIDSKLTGAAAADPSGRTGPGAAPVNK